MYDALEETISAQNAEKKVTRRRRKHFYRVRYKKLSHCKKPPMDQTPHVLIFPLPLQGPVNSMFKLAELLCRSNIRVTLLLTDDIYTRLHRHSNIQTRFQSYPGFQTKTISDGLPEDHPRGDKFMELFESLRTKTKPLFKKMLLSFDSPVSCVIADGILGFTGDVANEVGVPFYYVTTISACCLWVFFCLPKLVEAGEVPFDGDFDVLVKNVPGTESFLRRRDLPSFCRASESSAAAIQMYKTECDEIPRARGLILNTFEELEGPILSQMRNVCPKIYSIGPLHAHLKTKLEAKGTEMPKFSSSLWKEDQTCLAWLDNQPLKSVIYVSFGSLAPMTNDQLLEFCHGLVNSGQRFLWVIRSNALSSKDWKSQLPSDILEGMTQRGCIVEWAPQEEVLAHPAVGGFLTHSGWNSTLETVYEGVPMICWPYFVDQQVNSRFVEAEWKLGLDMKDTCERSIIEKKVRDLMETRKDEFSHRADQMEKSAKGCLSEGGSSYSSFDSLVKDIESLRA